MACEWSGLKGDDALPTGGIGHADRSELSEASIGVNPEFVDHPVGSGLDIDELSVRGRRRIHRSGAVPVCPTRLNWPEPAASKSLTVPLPALEA